MAEERIRKGRRNLARLFAISTAVTLAIAGSAWAAFPQDPPNDPNFAPAEVPPAAVTCLTKAGDNQEHYLFSKIPQCTPNAQDPEASAGMFIDRAWREFTTGNPQTVIAYIEGGINWRHDPAELANKVFLNAGELPPPTTPVNDGVLSAKDYANTADSNGNGLVDPEDIIVRFSNGSDQDHNGYVDDISGWDFYNDQNDPATLDSTYDHANGQMEQAAAETNNAFKGAGLCPDCRLLPIKAGAEALDRTDDLAQAWMYAADLNADVLVSTTADLGYSTFMRQAVNYTWRRGTAMVESSNDFNSTDHQGGMFHPHVLPGNAMVANSHGVDFIPNTAVLQNNLTTTYRARSGYSSWGTHNVFTAATTGGTTSEATPTVGAVVALVLAYGKEAAAEGRISRPLTPGEAIQVLRETASDIAAPVPAPVNWPAQPGFDLQYGYGRPNVYKAMEAISQGDVPPEAWIEEPRWYALFDPTNQGKVRVTGHVSALRSNQVRWLVEFAPGAEPTDSDFITAGSGQTSTGVSTKNGVLGTIDLSQIPASFWNKVFALSQRKELETNEHYTVTIRLRAFDPSGRMGEERRSIAVHHDQGLRPGFPRKIGPGGESQPVFADLQGTGSQAIIFGDSDGGVHALNGQGRELPGFPAFTNSTQVTRSHEGVNPGHEPLFTNLAVGDLDHDGKQWIVGTSSTGRVYIWDSHGNRRSGWPKALNLGVAKPAIPRPNSPFTRPPIMGASAPPVLADLDGNGTLEIVQAGWDGRLHVWRPNGQNLPGWPVEVTLPPGTTPPSGNIQINDHKLDLPPALAQLDADPQPELVQRTQYSFAPGAGLQVLAGRSNAVAYNADGSRVAGFLISAQALAIYYGSAQEFITEGVNNPVTADVTGDGLSEIAMAPGIFSATALFNPDGSQNTTYGPNPLGSFVGVVGSIGAIQAALQGNLPADIPVNFTTSGAFGNFGGGLSYAEPGSGAATVAGSLLLPGSGLPINSYARAFNASTGASLPGFPSKLQGLDFLGAPAIADVSGDGQPEVLIGGDSSALHAYSATTGGQAAGFPKFHTGWEVFGPSVGDIDGDGQNEVAIMTREGYVMVWNTPGRSSADQWWSYRHDEHNTGQYGIDTRPPGVARNARIESAQLRFRAPGDDWYGGKADRYTVRFLHPNGGVDTRVINATGSAGSVQKVDLLPNTQSVRVRAVDKAGNVGGWAAVK